MEDVKPKQNKRIKRDIIEFLSNRDGYICQFPGCTKPFTEEDPPTLDHWYPVSIFHDDSIENYKLMHFACNNKKGNTIPNADGTLVLADRKTKLPKMPRPDVCDECASGRLLLPGEICHICGSGPEPKDYPQSMKRKPQNCSHYGNEWCWWCVLGFIERKVNG